MSTTYGISRVFPNENSGGEKIKENIFDTYSVIYSVL